MSPFVELTFEGPLARLTMKRADKLNALDRAMVDALADAARAIEASREARVAILSGEGKAFCAGGDIAAWGGLPAAGDVARLDARGSSRLRSARAAARSADRGADRSRVRRRPGAGGGRGYSRRRKRDQARPCRSRGSAWRPAGRARNGSCAGSAVGRAAHGAGGRNVHGRGGARARTRRRGRCEGRGARARRSDRRGYRQRGPVAVQMSRR